jgi:hypothetical protein
VHEAGGGPQGAVTHPRLNREDRPALQQAVEAIARLSHPNIVMADDADDAEAGHLLVMEFINGRDLDTEVQQRGPLPVGEAVDCVLQAALGQRNWPDGPTGDPSTRRR